jgi:transposase
MAKGRQSDVTEQQLQTLIESWNQKDSGEIAAMLQTDEATINQWAARLRRSMKKAGMPEEQIKKLLPARRKARGNVFDLVVSRLMAGAELVAAKRRGRRVKKEG